MEYVWSSQGGHDVSQEIMSLELLGFSVLLLDKGLDGEMYTVSVCENKKDKSNTRSSWLLGKKQ